MEYETLFQNSLKDNFHKFAIKWLMELTCEHLSQTTTADGLRKV